MNAWAVVAGWVVLGLACLYLLLDLTGERNARLTWQKKADRRFTAQDAALGVLGRVVTAPPAVSAGSPVPAQTPPPASAPARDRRTLVDRDREWRPPPDAAPKPDVDATGDRGGVLPGEAIPDVPRELPLATDATDVQRIERSIRELTETIAARLTPATAEEETLLRHWRHLRERARHRSTPPPPPAAPPEVAQALGVPRERSGTLIGLAGLPGGYLAEPHARPADEEDLVDEDPPDTPTTIAAPALTRAVVAPARPHGGAPSSEGPEAAPGRPGTVARPLPSALETLTRVRAEPDVRDTLEIPAPRLVAPRPQPRAAAVTQLSPGMTRHVSPPAPTSADPVVARYESLVHIARVGCLEVDHCHESGCTGDEHCTHACAGCGRAVGLWHQARTEVLGPPTSARPRSPRRG